MRLLVEVGGKRFDVEADPVPPGVFFVRRGAEYAIEWDGVFYPARILPRGTPKERRAREAGAAEVTAVEAPLPGLVRSLLVEPGDSVHAGQPVLTLDAMKLENEIQSPVEGTVKEIRVAAGKAVDRGDVLVVIEES